MNSGSLFPTLFRTPTLPVPSRGSLFPLADWLDEVWAEFFPRTHNLRAKVTKEEYIAEIPLSGITESEDIEVSVENQLVRVYAANSDGSRSYSYTFRVPKWVKAEDLSARFQENTLYIRAPRPPEARPHYVPVERVTSKKDAVT